MRVENCATDLHSRHSLYSGAGAKDGDANDKRRKYNRKDATDTCTKGAQHGRLEVTTSVSTATRSLVTRINIW
jgi:hypothetical protein